MKPEFWVTLTSTAQRRSAPRCTGMKRKTFVTESLSCEIADDRPSRPITETEFEKRRGISNVEVRPGFTQVHVSLLQGDLMAERIRILTAASEAGISLDFLKLTPAGMSFLIPQDKTTLMETVLNNAKVTYNLFTRQSIVLVHAVNMRDEEGMIAGIVRRAIQTGVSVDHVTDMHDRMLLVLKDSQAEKFAEMMRSEVTHVG